MLKVFDVTDSNSQPLHFLDLVNVELKVVSSDLVRIPRSAFPSRSGPLNINLCAVQRELRL